MTLDEQLQSVLHARADLLQPRDDQVAWRHLTQQLDRRRRRQRVARLAVLPAAAVVALVVVLVITAGGDPGIEVQPAGPPPGWIVVSNPDAGLRLTVPPGWQRLAPATEQRDQGDFGPGGGLEVLSVGTTPRPTSGVIYACTGDIRTAPGTYLSIYEYPSDADLARPDTGGTFAPWSFQARPTEFRPSHRGHAWCGADGSSVPMTQAQNWFSTHTFSDGGRRFYVRIVTIQDDPEGTQQKLATRVLNTLHVRPLSTGATQPPPVPTTVSDQAIRTQMHNVRLFDEGDCVGSPDGDLTTPVSCSEPHFLEYFATYDFQGTVIDATRGCNLLFEDYTGIAYDTLQDSRDNDFGYGAEILNPEVAAATGLHQIRCSINANISPGTDTQPDWLHGSLRHD